MKEYKIVTNNTKVGSRFRNVMFVEGDYMDVLVKVRDLVHIGHSLINHPLPASSRMFLSPIRSIIVEKTPSSQSMELMDSAIEQYRKSLGNRHPDQKNRKDYEEIDYQLLQAAFDELERNKALHEESIKI